LAAEHFAKHAPLRLLVLNRTLERAEGLARAVRGEAWALERIDEALHLADVVLFAVRLPEPVVSFAQVSQALGGRSGRPLAVLDLGMPRNVPPQTDGLTNVFLHDIEALKQVVDVNLARRRQEVVRVEEIIQYELRRLVDRHHEQQAGPLIGALRAAVEEMRRGEVEKAAAGLPPEQRDAVDRATRAVVNKLLHGPMQSIKEVAREQESSREQLEMLRRMFDHLLPSNDDEPPPRS
jgi:glutamyl-tRNA reductase